MKTQLMALSLAATLLGFAPLGAQEPNAPSKPEKEHQWLHQFVGEWETAAEGTAGPGQPAFTCQGKTTSRMLGGLWLVSETQNDVGGTTINAIQTIGYDPETKKYVGTWVDSMINHMWKYEGTVDPTGKILTLEAKGPNMISPGKVASYRDSFEFKSADHIVNISSMLMEDGKWVQFMKGSMKRKK
jgi:Protein of unknown function (DUF1579)